MCFSQVICSLLQHQLLSVNRKAESLLGRKHISHDSETRWRCFLQSILLALFLTHQACGFHTSPAARWFPHLSPHKYLKLDHSTGRWVSWASARIFYLPVAFHPWGLCSVWSKLFSRDSLFTRLSHSSWYFLVWKCHHPDTQKWTALLTSGVREGIG